MIQRLFNRLPFFLAERLLPLILFGSVLSTGCANGPANRLEAKVRPLPPKEAAMFEDRIDALSHFAMGVHHDLKQQPAEATESYLKAAYADLRNEALVLDVARRLVREQKGTEAIELLKIAVAQHPSGVLFASLGLAYFHAGNTNLAIEASQQAIERAPDDLPAYQNLAALHLQAGRTNDAVNVLTRAAGRTNAPPEFLVGLADLFGRYQRQQVFPAEQARIQILRLLDVAAEQQPVNPVVVQRLADLYLLHGEVEKAEPLYADLLRKDPRIPGLRERLANIYIRINKSQEAAKLLEEIQRENPTDPATHYFLGSIAYEAKDFDKAADYFQTALKLNPDFEALYYDLAGVHLARQDPAEAVAVLEEAKARFKLNFTLEFYTGIALSSMEQWDEAISHLSSAELIARTSEPNRLTHVFYFQLGAAYERSGNIPDAVTAFRKCLEISPGFADALNYLGYMWAERGENLEEARSMIERAVEAEPENAAFLDSMAWVLFKLNQTEEALDYMLRAVAHSEKPDPTLFDHLGDIHAELKQFDKAREAYTNALNVKPDEKIQEKLDSLLPR